MHDVMFAWQARWINGSIYAWTRLNLRRRRHGRSLQTLSYMGELMQGRVPRHHSGQGTLYFESSIGEVLLFILHPTGNSVPINQRLFILVPLHHKLCTYTFKMYKHLIFILNGKCSKTYIIITYKSGRLIFIRIAKKTIIFSYIEVYFHKVCFHYYLWAIGCLVNIYYV